MNCWSDHFFEVLIGLLDVLQKSKNIHKKPGTVACAVIIATGTIEIGCLPWQATPRGPCWISLASTPACLTWNLKG
jgi:hypothetical protein